MNREQRRAKAKIPAPAPGEVKVAAPYVCIGIPSGDELKANFAMAYAAMSYFCGLHGQTLAFANQKGSMLPKNRNLLVEQARTLGCTHLLQIDSDISFPPYALWKLLQHKKPVVGCTYARRSEPHDNLAVPLGKAPTQDARGLWPVDRLPTGMLLVELQVFDKIKKPYFRFPTIEATDELPHGRVEGEDYYFCDAARAAGFDVYLDVELSFELTHWGECGWKLVDTSDPNGKRVQMVELQSSV